MFQNLLLTGYELLSALLPFSVFLWVYARHSRKRGAPLSGTELAAMLLFGLYIAAVLYYTGSGTLFDLLRYGCSLRPGQVNLLPFSRQIDWMGYFLNLLLFVPLGAALPFLCREADDWRRVLCAGASLSLLIELSQLLNNRSADVDDILLNTVGALAGYGLYRLVYRLAEGRYVPARRRGQDLLLAAGILFAGHFLLFDELGAAKLLYRF